MHKEVSHGFAARRPLSFARVSLSFNSFHAGILLMVWAVAAFAEGTNKIEIPGYSITTPSPAKGNEWWMSYTKPLEMSRYALTNGNLKNPLVVSILRYPNAKRAKSALDASWRSRPQAPKNVTVPGWDGAHRWPTDLCLLKEDHVVILYDLPPDFPDAKMNGLLAALADTVTKAGQNITAEDRDAANYFEDSLEACGTNEIRCVWFLDDRPKVGMMMTFNLEKENVFTVRDVYKWALQNSGTREITHSQALNLKEMTAQMPASDENIEFVRTVSVSVRHAGVTEVFHYDRRHAPEVVKRLYDIGGGYLNSGKTDPPNPTTTANQRLKR